MSGTTTRDGNRAVLLAIDTATTRAIAAIGDRDGTLDALSTWTVGHRHGETLLPAIDRLLGDDDHRRARIGGVIVGTGPGAFTGLRVGIATAKGIALGLRRPIVGVGTGRALLAAAAAANGRALESGVLLLPAGPSDRVVVRAVGPAAILPSGADPELEAGTWLVAVDLEDRAPAEAVALGEAARDGLAAELLRIGAARLAANEPDDLATLVPEYVTPPRGAATSQGEVAWSHDPR